jgi:hypothetical protein
MGDTPINDPQVRLSKLENLNHKSIDQRPTSLTPSPCVSSNHSTLPPPHPLWLHAITPCLHLDTLVRSRLFCPIVGQVTVYSVLPNSGSHLLCVAAVSPSPLCCDSAAPSTPPPSSRSELYRLIHLAVDWHVVVSSALQRLGRCLLLPYAVRVLPAVFA